jgi:methionine-rich copper-binding protein CopC
MSRTIAILLTAALGLGATAANAHPRLQTSNPAAGATLKAGPKEIRLNFTEELVPLFTGLELKNASGKFIPSGKAALIPGDSKKIVVPIGAPLTAGTYNVVWHAVSVDTHRVNGSYSFKVTR